MVNGAIWVLAPWPHRLRERVGRVCVYIRGRLPPKIESVYSFRLFTLSILFSMTTYDPSFAAGYCHFLHGPFSPLPPGNGEDISSELREEFEECIGKHTCNDCCYCDMDGSTCPLRADQLVLDLVCDDCHRGTCDCPSQFSDRNEEGEIDDNAYHDLDPEGWCLYEWLRILLTF